MVSRPWWTEADQAELEAACWALVCALEVIEDPEKRGELIEAVGDWLHMRRMVSRAEWYRRRHLYERLAQIEEMVA